jgi:4-aminobutyrate aminotransferase
MPRPVATERHRRVVADAQPLVTNLLAVRAEGAWVETADGRRVIDCTSGVATVNLGHNHPRVVAAAREQMERMVHGGGVFMSEPVIALAERLARATPAPIGAFAFATSGCEAVEGALGLARHATGRPGVVAFRGGFHGRTRGALACSTSRARMRAGHPALGAGVAIAPFPRAGPGDPDGREAAREALRALDDLHRHDLPPGETACYLVEPVQGHGGCHPAGRAFLEGLRERADRHGALLVLDEVQTGFGRTGAPFAAQLHDVEPDVICLAKAIANGLPLSAVGAAPDLMARWPAGAHGSTFGANPVSCAAACAVVDTLEEEALSARAAALGAHATRRLRAIARRLDALVEVRGPGLMLGIAMADPATGRPRADLAAEAQAAGEQEGVIVLRAGPEDNVLRVLPPLVIGEHDLDLALDRLGRALDRACGGRAEVRQPARAPRRRLAKRA